MDLFRVYPAPRLTEALVGILLRQAREARHRETDRWIRPPHDPVHLVCRPPRGGVYGGAQRVDQDMAIRSQTRATWGHIDTGRTHICG